MPPPSIRQAFGASGPSVLRRETAVGATAATAAAAAAGRTRAAPLCRHARLQSSLAPAAAAASAAARLPTTTRAAPSTLLRATGLLAPASSWLQAPQPRARLLSTSAPCSAQQAITFAPSSSAELDAALDTIRSKIILPSYLGSEQRRQLFDKRYEERLRASPITLDLDGTIHRFTHMDLLRDLPNARAAARAAVDRMATRDDFANLPGLLEGLQHAGRRLRAADHARIARRAGERGCIYVVIECARTVRRTGFRLGDSEVVAEVLTHVQLKAVDSAWDEAATRQALVWAELVVDLLEDEQHGRRAVPATTVATTPPPPPPPPPPAFPLARDPQVLAARLHLAAAVAERFAGADADADAAAVQTVQRYGAQLAALWPAGAGLRRGLHAEATYTDRRGELHYLQDDNKFLGVAAPLLHGLDTAVRVLGPTDAALAGALGARRDALAAEVQAALAAAPDRRGAAVYKKLFG